MNDNGYSSGIPDTVTHSSTPRQPTSDIRPSVQPSVGFSPPVPVTSSQGYDAQSGTPTSPYGAPQPAYGQAPAYGQQPAYGQPPAYGAPSPYGQPYGSFPAPTSGLAIASLVLGLVGVGLVGLILGFIALRETAPGPTAKGGRGLAIAGTIISGVGVLFSLLYLVFIFFLFGTGMGSPSGS